MGALMVELAQLSPPSKRGRGGDATAGDGDGAAQGGAEGADGGAAEWAGGVIDQLKPAMLRDGAAFKEILPVMLEMVQGEDAVQAVKELAAAEVSLVRLSCLVVFH